MHVCMFVCTYLYFTSQARPTGLGCRVTRRQQQAARRRAGWQHDDMLLAYAKPCTTRRQHTSDL